MNQRVERNSNESKLLYFIDFQRYSRIQLILLALSTLKKYDVFIIFRTKIFLFLASLIKMIKITPPKIQNNPIIVLLINTLSFYYFSSILFTNFNYFSNPISTLNSLDFGSFENLQACMILLSFIIEATLLIEIIFVYIHTIIIIKLMQGEDQIIFIVEHMEPYLFEWCLYEYQSMKEYLQDYPCELHITNAKSFYEYKGDHQAQNQKHIQQLEDCFKSGNGRFKLIKQSLQEIHSNFGEDTCMLDMRAQSQLIPNQKWKAIVFGGVLGDHPPRDRPAPIRSHFKSIRHLGKSQLATDTAVLVSRLILKNHINLKDIPMIDEPTVKGLNKHGQKTKIQMEGFSYVSKELDIKTGKMQEGLSKKDKKQIYMNEGVKRLLLFQDLDQNLLM